MPFSFFRVLRRPASRGWTTLLCLVGLMLPCCLSAQALDWQYQFNGPATPQLSTLRAPLDGRIYALGDQGTLISTTDGISWRRHTVPFENNLTDIIVGHGVSLLSDANYGLYRSTDGENWTSVPVPQTAGGAKFQHTIEYGNGRFVRTSAKGARASLSGLTSPGSLEFSVDGEVWTPVSFGGDIERVAIFAKDKFILPAADGIWTSGDGANWTRVNDLDFRRKVIAVGNGIIVAADRPEVESPQIHTSPDGITWSNAPLPSPDWGTKLFFYEGAFYNQTFPGDVLQRSTDGVNWHPTPKPESALLEFAVQQGELRMTMAGYSYSPHTLLAHRGSGNWQPVKISYDAPRLDSLAFGNALWVAPGFRRPEGGYWNDDGFLPSAPERHIRVKFCHDRFFYFEGNPVSGNTEIPARIYSSPDGIIATLITTADDTLRSGGDVAYGNGQFLLIGPSGTHKSNDGITWSLVDATPLNSGRLAFGAGLFVRIEPYKIHTSPDGELWTERYATENVPSQIVYRNLNEIIFAQDRFVVIGNRSGKTLSSYQGFTLHSADGMAWVSTESHPFSQIGYDPSLLAFADGVFIASGSANATWPSTRFSVPGIYTSADGSTWRRSPSPAASLSSFTAGTDGKVYTVADGTVLVAPIPVLAPPPTANPLRITAQPDPQVTLYRNQSALLSVTVAGQGPFSYQWRRNGEDIPWATTSTFAIHAGHNNGRSAVYDVVVRNLTEDVISTSSQITIADSWLSNLSSRAYVGTADAAVVQGLVMNAPGEAVLVRAIGPTLAEFGIEAPLADPQIEVRAAASSALIRTNDNWSPGAPLYLENLFNRLGAFALPPGSADSAVMVSLTPQPHTLTVSGVGDTTGIALTEIYSESNAGRLANLSTRAQVGPGDRVLTAGFVISGSVPLRVLIRGIGPTLADFDIANPLPNPRILLFDSTGAEIGNNDTWTDNTFAAEIRSVSAQVGAFALRETSNDAALLVWLDPGTYTVQIQGVGDPAGIALIELYEVPKAP